MSSAWLPSLCGRYCITVEREDKASDEDADRFLLAEVIPSPPRMCPHASLNLFVRIFYTAICLPLFSVLTYLRLAPPKGKPGSRWKHNVEYHAFWYFILVVWFLAILVLPVIISYWPGSKLSDSHLGIAIYLFILLFPLLVVCLVRGRQIHMPASVVNNGRGRPRGCCTMFSVSGWRNFIAICSFIVETVQLSALAFANHDENPFWFLVIDIGGSSFLPLLVGVLITIGVFHIFLSVVVSLATTLSKGNPNGNTQSSSSTNSLRSATGFSQSLNIQNFKCLAFFHPLVAELCFVTILFTLFRAVSCHTPSDATQAVVQSNASMVCWEGTHKHIAFIALYALSALIPFAVLLSPLIRADSSLYFLVKGGTVNNNNNRPNTTTTTTTPPTEGQRVERRASWMGDEVPEAPEVQLRPVFCSADRICKIVLCAVAALMRGHSGAIVPTFTAVGLARILASKALPADKDMMFAHRGPCYYAAINNMLTLLYSACLWAAIASGLSAWQEWNELWQQLLTVGLGWFLIAIFFWWATINYFRGATDRTRMNGTCELEAVETHGLKRDSLDGPSSQTSQEDRHHPPSPSTRALLLGQTRSGELGSPGAKERDSAISSAPTLHLPSTMEIIKDANKSEQTNRTGSPMSMTSSTTGGITAAGGGGGGGGGGATGPTAKELRDNNVNLTGGECQPQNLNTSAEKLPEYPPPPPPRPGSSLKNDDTLIRQLGSGTKLATGGAAIDIDLGNDDNDTDPTVLAAMKQPSQNSGKSKTVLPMEHPSAQTSQSNESIKGSLVMGSNQPQQPQTTSAPVLGTLTLNSTQTNTSTPANKKNNPLASIPHLGQQPQPAGASTPNNLSTNGGGFSPPTLSPNTTTESDSVLASSNMDLMAQDGEQLQHAQLLLQQKMQEDRLRWEQDKAQAVLSQQQRQSMEGVQHGMGSPPSQLYQDEVMVPSQALTPPHHHQTPPHTQQAVPTSQHASPVPMYQQHQGGTAPTHHSPPSQHGTTQYGIPPAIHQMHPQHIAPFYRDQSGQPILPSLHPTALSQYPYSPTSQPPPQYDQHHMDLDAQNILRQQQQQGQYDPYDPAHLNLTYQQQQMMYNQQQLASPPQHMEYENESVEDPNDERDKKSQEGNYWNANEDEEDQAEYRKGGYHAVFVGEIFNNRYRVIKKLGWGEFSTVWLAWDFIDFRYVALKISKSAKDYRKASMYEVDIFQHINTIIEGSGDTQDEGQRGFFKDGSITTEPQCCVRMYDSFDHRGPNGTHLVMVFEVLGPNLLSLISLHDFKGIDVKIVKATTKQILKGLAFLHEEVKITHTDLKPENILLNRPTEPVLNAIKDHVASLEKELGGQSLDRLIPKERDGIHHTLTDRLAYEYGITISDLGAARWHDKQYPVAVIQTREYRSPEVILGYAEVGSAIDVWSLACIVFELITGDFLFDPKSEKNVDKDLYHLALFMQLLGDIPKHTALGKGKYCGRYFNARGDFRHKKLPSCKLEAVFYRNYGLSDKESRELASFLEPMLIYDPKRRITAREAIKHPWLNIEDDDEM